MDSLESLILNGEAGSYDFAFIDAEKRMNEKYFELLLQLVKVGGLIVIDNVLWHGKVADQLIPTKPHLLALKKNLSTHSFSLIRPLSRALL
ncbi:hypothetical protein LR48_Vigan05g133800 [Vigna angularis]|uniref:Caffeoyl-CoA O-methyltransferase n=1 Tax=Phaseolus angularis TaxID=3914 RepID=A0A0L9ULV6_PHAAN|nr:hypothetical protein LR48_Vigan05g133800 [Vigna angularis]